MIYHNPRCSKSRASLELLNEAGIEPQIVEYLKNPPSAATILCLARLLGVAVAELLRRGETEFREAKDLPDLDDDAALAAWLNRHPAVLQRPIVVSADGSRAVLGRPPDKVVELVSQ
jgi:arsenate reductase